MEAKACRDCGFALAPSARGCPGCAMNLEAERSIERVFGGLIIALVLVIAGVIYFVFR